MASNLSICLSKDNDTTAVIIPNSSTPIILSHRQLYNQVLSFQRKLASLGISKGDAVAIALPNGLEFVVAFLAIALQRAICAPLNPAYKQDEFEFYLEDLKAAIVLVPEGAIAESGEAVRAARICGTDIAEVHFDWCEVSLTNAERRGITVRRSAVVNNAEAEDVALILHTSGTTGKPKRVPLTHRNLCRTMVNIQNTYQLSPSDRNLLVMPLFHVHGLLAAFMAPLMSRGSVVIPIRFSASEFWRDFVHHKANWYTAVPTIHQILLKHDLPNPLPYIRFIRSCSSPLPPIIHQRMERLFNTPVVEAYAMTETAHQMTSNPLGSGVRKPGSVGLPQGMDLHIMDSHGNALSRGRIGEVCVLGDNVTSGYLGDVAPPFNRYGYLRTGDQGYLDHEGYLFLTGRIKELINKGGEKISPIEIDNVVIQHPLVQEAVSFAITDELYGENIAVAIVLLEGAVLPPLELLGWMEERVARMKVPKKVFYTDKMPKTATGKIQRRLVAKIMLEKENESGAGAGKRNGGCAAGLERAAECKDGPRRGARFPVRPGPSISSSSSEGEEKTEDQKKEGRVGRQGNPWWKTYTRWFCL